MVIFSQLYLIFQFYVLNISCQVLCVAYFFFCFSFLLLLFISYFASLILYIVVYNQGQSFVPGTVINFSLASKLCHEKGTVIFD